MYACLRVYERENPLVERATDGASVEDSTDGASVEDLCTRERERERVCV